MKTITKRLLRCYLRDVEPIGRFSGDVGFGIC